MSYEPPADQAWNQAEGQPPPGQYGQAPGPYGAPGPYAPGPGFAQGPYGKPPAAYRPWAITCIACGVLFSIIIGMPCGLVALYYSRRVQPAWLAGNQHRASQASRRAMTWAIASTLFDVLGFIVVISLFSHGSGSTS
jgi:Interferon-induced transmembrane protein